MPEFNRDRLTAAQDSPSETDLSSLFNYPSIGKLFDSPSDEALTAMRGRLRRTAESLDRIIRQGERAEAERAARARRALDLSAGLLDELAALRRKTT